MHHSTPPKPQDDKQEKMPALSMRYDLQIIASWIAPASRVLDLGCGEGDLLHHLKKSKAINGIGIDYSEKNVATCISKGLSVLQGDINEEVEDYADGTFDYVILSQTLQQVYEPQKTIKSLLRIGRKVVVSFPNFSHWNCRFQLFFQGQAPRTNQLPYRWYNTPNIRVITIKDFQNFAKASGFCILKEVAINTQYHDLHGQIIRFLPNLRATYGIFLIGNNK